MLETISQKDLVAYHLSNNAAEILYVLDGMDVDPDIGVCLSANGPSPYKNCISWGLLRGEFKPDSGGYSAVVEITNLGRAVLAAIKEKSEPRLCSTAQ